MKKQEVTERVKTFEDAQRETGRQDVPAFLDVPEDLRDYFKAQYKAIVVCEALNEGWKADWNDDDQYKYFPWFYMSSGGFVFYGTYYRDSDAYAGGASRLCFKTRELARYAGEQFLDIWSDIILK